MKRLATAFVIAAASMGAVASADESFNAIVVVGAGYTGSWDTEVLLANPFPSPLIVLVGRIPFPCLVTCPPPVPVTAEIPPDGQVRVLASQAGGNEVSFLFIVPDSDGQAGLPVVRARAFAVDQPSRAMELPAISYATWLDRGNVPLVFPGALKSATAYSNLSVVELSGAPVSFRVDAIDSSGHAVASLNGHLDGGGFGVLADVLRQMNVADFNGQLRLTKTGGDGLLAGALATLDTDGSFAVSGGFNP